ncbi:class I SAM-dependent methyltransferase [Solibacillus sp. CAU 1738]|uniref:class I SAM-dependent methyltransferase n=1 Tax=Solibacillus sp. CAU 1738 TaxID=3140363 RepID=UPI00326034B2
MQTSWQREDVTKHYLEQVRGGIPFGAEQAQIMLQVVNHFVKSPELIIDLGCGNGFLAEILLRTYKEAKAICIDHSEPMIDQAKENLTAYADRCALYVEDFSHSILSFAKSDSVDCIVSGYAIHHLPHEEKKTLYKDIYKLLKRGGIFINIEHTASATPSIEKLHDELFIDHLTAYNKGNREQIAAEYYNRPDKADNILERVDIQVNWLRDIGFQHADCYFKWMELAVLGGVK